MDIPVADVMSKDTDIVDRSGDEVIEGESSPMSECEVNDLAGTHNALGLHCHYVKQELREALQHHYEALNILCNHILKYGTKKSQNYSKMYWDIKNISIEAHIALTLSDIANVLQKQDNYDEAIKAYTEAIYIFRNYCNISDPHPLIATIKRSISQLDHCITLSQHLSEAMGSDPEGVTSTDHLSTLDELTSSSTDMEKCQQFEKIMQSFSSDWLEKKMFYSLAETSAELGTGDSIDNDHRSLDDATPLPALGLNGRSSSSPNLVEDATSIDLQQKRLSTGGCKTSINSAMASSRSTSYTTEERDYFKWSDDKGISKYNL